MAALTARDVPCPRCGAPADEPCTDLRTGGPEDLGNEHEARKVLADLDDLDDLRRVAAAECLEIYLAEQERKVTQ